MIYIDPAPNTSGAYPNPKNQPFPGCIPLDGEQAATFFEYNGFVTVENGVVTPNTEAWEAWKESLPPDPEPVPTMDDRMTAMEQAIERGLRL